MKEGLLWNPAAVAIYPVEVAGGRVSMWPFCDGTGVFAFSILKKGGNHHGRTV